MGLNGPKPGHIDHSRYTAEDKLKWCYKCSRYDHRNCSGVRGRARRDVCECPHRTGIRRLA